MAKAPHPARKTAERISKGRPSPIPISRKSRFSCVRRRVSTAAARRAENAGRADAPVPANCDEAPADRDDAQDGTSAQAPQSTESAHERAACASALLPLWDRAG